MCRVNPAQDTSPSAGYIFPCWLIVTNTSGTNTTLAQALATASYRRWLDGPASGVQSYTQRQTTIVLPTPVQGAYVRLQRQDSLYLSIAEVEVFSERT